MLDRQPTPFAITSVHALGVRDALVRSSHDEHSICNHRADIRHWGVYRGNELVYNFLLCAPKDVLRRRVYDVHDGDWQPGDRTQVRTFTKIQLASMVAEWDTPESDNVGRSSCWICAMAAKWAVSVALEAKPDPRNANLAAAVERHADERARKDPAWAGHSLPSEAPRVAIEVKVLADEAAPEPTARAYALEGRWSFEQATSAAQRASNFFALANLGPAATVAAKAVEQLDLFAQQLDLFTSEDYLARLEAPRGWVTGPCECEHNGHFSAGRHASGERHSYGATLPGHVVKLELQGSAHLCHVCETTHAAEYIVREEAAK
jgi:hypothetical protein